MSDGRGDVGSSSAPARSFEAAIASLWMEYKPSKHPFFRNLGRAPSEVVRGEAFLNGLYLRYQGAMHASRAMAYRMPHLDNIELRMIKLRVLADDDGAPGGDSHHFQLTRTWHHMLGKQPDYDDDAFGDLDDLRALLDDATASFVRACQEQYPKSLGPWVMVEGLAHDWIGALQEGLEPHFPGVSRTDYFMENFSSCIEERHAEEALSTTMKVIAKKPALAEGIIQGAQATGTALATLWDGLDMWLAHYLRSARQLA